MTGRAQTATADLRQWGCDGVRQQSLRRGDTRVLGDGDGGRVQGGSRFRWGSGEGGRGTATSHVGLSTACSGTGEVSRVYGWVSQNEVVLTGLLPAPEGRGEGRARGPAGRRRQGEEGEKRGEIQGRETCGANEVARQCPGSLEGADVTGQRGRGRRQNRGKKANAGNGPLFPTPARGKCNPPMSLLVGGVGGGFGRTPCALGLSSKRTAIRLSQEDMETSQGEETKATWRAPFQKFPTYLYKLSEVAEVRNAVLGTNLFIFGVCEGTARRFCDPVLIHRRGIFWGSRSFSKQPSSISASFLFVSVFPWVRSHFLLLFRLPSSHSVWGNPMTRFAKT